MHCLFEEACQPVVSWYSAPRLNIEWAFCRRTILCSPLTSSHGVLLRPRVFVWYLLPLLRVFISGNRSTLPKHRDAPTSWTCSITPQVSTPSPQPRPQPQTSSWLSSSSGIGGGSVLQHSVLLAHRHGGAGVDNHRAGDVRAPLLDTERRRVLVVSHRVNYSISERSLQIYSQPGWYSVSSSHVCNQGGQTDKS